MWLLTPTRCEQAAMAYAGNDPFTGELSRAEFNGRCDNSMIFMPRTRLPADASEQSIKIRAEIEMRGY